MEKIKLTTEQIEKYNKFFDALEDAPDNVLIFCALSIASELKARDEKRKKGLN